MLNSHSRPFLAATALVGVCSFSTVARAIDVASQADWNVAAAAVAAAGAGSTVAINFTGGFVLSSSLAQLQATAANVTVNITGNNQTINGGAAFQGIQVSGANALTVNISNLAVTNTAAIGGAGQAGQAGYANAALSYGSGGGGGGGMGAGGGLYVGAGANVSLASVTFTGSSATGGTGGNGGVAQNVAPSGTGGNGGAGGAVNNGGAVGGGASGGAGGNNGLQGTAGSAGTAGAGGGGGGGSGTANSVTYTAPNSGGSAGSTGGGSGGSGGAGVTNYAGINGPGSDGGSGGSGGAARGGAIFVENGATLTILDTGINGASATGGAGGAQGAGLGANNFAGDPGLNGQAAGSGIYLTGVTANIGVSTGTLTYANTIGGTGFIDGGVMTTLNKTGAGTLVLNSTNTFTGNVNISGGTLQVASQANLGSGAKNLVMSGGTTFAMTATATYLATLGYRISNAASFSVAPGATATLSGLIADGTSPGTLVKTNSGTLILSGNNTYTGGTAVSGGTLRFNSANAAPVSSFIVSGGATLDLNGFDRTFTGLVGGGTITGGNVTLQTGAGFSPGDGAPNQAMAITGNLTLQPGVNYFVQVDPTTASKTNVTGTATLGGATVNANYAAGSYISKQYTILTAAGGVNGTFGSLVNTNLPTNFTAGLSHDANNAYLNLTLNFVPVPPTPTPPTPTPPTPPTPPGYNSGLSGNQQNVANTLVNYFNTNGGIPLIFGALTPTGLTQVSGETATGSQQATFDAMTQFMGLMTDPFTSARGGPGAGASGFAAEEDALAYAASGRKRTTAERQAYAMVTKAPPLRVYDPRWNVWAAGFGGSRTTDGNDVVGSNRTTSSIVGGAVGADYWFSPSTVAGISMAGGGTNFSVANGGSGTSDLFQAGAFVRHNVASAYVTAAAAYGWQNIRTDRLVAGVERLRADFNANTYSGRIEGGNRWLLPHFGGIGVTPYAALQVTAFDLPGYSEFNAAGVTTFGLTYAGKTVTNTRSELGLRTDKSFAMNDALLTLRGRAAWAHDYNADRNVQATFQTLPGTSFVVNGATASRDAALTSASAEWGFRNGLSLTATFDGEFSNTTRSYAGKGIVRYQW